MRYTVLIMNLVLVLLLGSTAFADTVRFKRIPTQFIAALVEPGAAVVQAQRSGVCGKLIPDPGAYG